VRPANSLLSKPRPTLRAWSSRPGLLLVSLVILFGCSAPGTNRTVGTSDSAVSPDSAVAQDSGGTGKLATSMSGTKLDVEASTLSFSVNGRVAFVYQFSPQYAIPHIWPLRSPSGRSLLVQHPDPYPHHRSLWIVDKVQLRGGPITDFYHEWKNLIDPKQPELGHHSYIRHDEIGVTSAGSDGASAQLKLTWMSKNQMPVLTQYLKIEVQDLGAAEYLLSMNWDLRADFGDVIFHSDWVHYAWPFLRMDPAFSGENGGTILDDQGRRGQKQTNQQYAQWIDYSNTVDGVTEGLAVFTPNDGQKRKWLTREYGTFGPRRPDAQSGEPFTLKRGEILQGAVKILVHNGDADQARVAQRYAKIRW
jgi:methane monooxygenase PmoA-like